MRFKGLDLNLLSALDVLLEERSVSRAAQRLNLSQPAMSAALSRLRDYFGDPLLVAQGRRMIPTAEALALQNELGPILRQVEEMIARSTAFDPATSDRVFRICASDYLVAVLFPALARGLAKAAPAVRLDIVPPAEEARTAMERGELDLLLTPEEHCVPGHPTRLLFEERHVAAGWDGNPAIARPLTSEAFFAAGHIAVRLGTVARASFAETRFEAIERKRRIEITVSSFAMVPPLLVGTERLAVMHERLARTMAGNFPIGWQELPFAFPPMAEMIQYNRARGDDAGLQWLVGELLAASGAGASPA